LTAQQLDAIVTMSVTAARSLELALYSLEPEHQLAAKQLATFLLGVLRTLEHIDSSAAIAWRDRVDVEIGRDVIRLCRQTGEPAFMDSEFLSFLRARDISG
jgi:hypothetical protein